ncbi:hypothetical protein CBR_g50979 [Chara braunii]|uniref:Uncharacterized protein n=1 Tax=Chara braunii TaxID=69332 RepID=A0A388M7S0_CHABU|nr:hypothetical protein CBR_g50979 [Chara braunii]|eukprot:GBG90634.1 hypothetical protein CBR_g50979 [Chara braunii]
MVVLSADFVLLNLLHLILLIVFQKHGKERGADGKMTTKWYRITNEMFAVMSPLLVFFLVFYNNQAYNRYMEQFFIARKLEGKVKHITNRLRAYFRHDPFPGAEQSMREMLRTVIVAHYCLYFRLPRYSLRQIHEWGWDYLRKYGLVKKEEYAVLVAKTGPEIMGETLAFCLERLGQHVRYGHIDTLTFNAFEQDLHVMAGFIMSITAYANNPVPFAYYHLANLLTLGQLALVAYAFVFLDSYLTIIVFALLTTALLGLRDMSCALSDPFGVDDTDFPTIVPTARSHVGNEALLSRDSVFGNAALPGNPPSPSPPPPRHPPSPPSPAYLNSPT